MLKLVIVTSDYIQVRRLINFCIGKIPTLQITAILTSQSELEDFKKKNTFDIILFDHCNFVEHHPVDYDVIIINSFKSPVRKFDKKIVLSSKQTFSFLIKQIANFSQKITSNNVYQRAVQTLIDLGFSFKHIGTKYLADAIQYTYFNQYDSNFENLEKDIYPFVAGINHTDVEKVKWSMARSINMMYLNHTTKSISILEEYFCLDHMQKPTPKLVIGMVRNKLIVSDEEKD